MRGPKEDPEDRKARLRERRLAQLERRRASEQNASGASRDLGAVYDLRALSMFSQARPSVVPGTRKT